MARCHSSLERPRDRSTRVCRLRDIVVDMPQELLKMNREHNKHGLLEPADAWLVFSCYQQTMSRTNPPADPRHDALPDVGAVRYLWFARVCAGGGCCSNTFVGTTICASGRPPSTCRPT